MKKGDFGLKMRILVLGISGMLGGQVYKTFKAETDFEVIGFSRSRPSISTKRHVRFDENDVFDLDILGDDHLAQLLETVRPNVTINCIGLTKQVPNANNPMLAIKLNALLPHRLSKISKKLGSKLIHISTDCVFDGDCGGYSETDQPNARDLYGLTKQLGEILDKDHVITLRTSIIGHQQSGFGSLVDWFLSQNGHVKGYSRAYFSGLPTVTLSRIMARYCITESDLTGLYNVASMRISKLELLKLVKAAYEKDIQITACDQVSIDRSLDGSKFAKVTGFSCPDWPALIDEMRTSWLDSSDNIRVKDVQK